MTDQDIHNKLSRPREQWYTIEPKPDSFGPKIGKSIANEFFGSLNSETKEFSPVPTTSSRDIVNVRGEPAGNVTPPLDSEGSKPGSQLYQLHTSPNTPQASSHSSAAHKALEHEQPNKPLDSRDDPESSKDSPITERMFPDLLDFSPLPDEPTFTFLGLSESFDLACICSDTGFWRDDSGIDSQHVKDCLSKVNVCLGPTLRATYAEPDHEEELNLRRFFEK